MGVQFAARAFIPAPQPTGAARLSAMRAGVPPRHFFETPAAPAGNRALGAMFESAGLLVEEGALVEKGKMTKGAFLDALEQAVTVSAGEGLAVAGRSSLGCPWIAQWFGYYREKSAAHLESALRKFAPSAAGATDAMDYIPSVAARVRAGVDRWVQTGRFGDLPEGLSAPKPDAPESVAASLGEGQALDGNVRSRMERALGTGLGDIRIHTGTRAAEVSSLLDSRAFAAGDQVAFGAGEYQPGTLIGDALLAHELAHAIQQRQEAPPANSAILEQDANRSAAASIASLWGGSLTGVRSAAGDGVPRLRSGLQLQSCRSDAFRKRPEKGNFVEFQNSHPLARHSQDRRADPLWVAGTTDHAAAYTMGAAPTVAARAGLPAALNTPAAQSLSVRVIENGNVRGSRSGLRAGTGSMEISGLSLPSLSGSDAVRSSDYTFSWEGSIDGTNWVPLMVSGPHRIYWLFASPKISPLRAVAAKKATSYAAGATAAQDVAARLRSGLRGIDMLRYSPIDPIDEDPFQIFPNTIGICTDYANVLTELALSVGLNANAVMFFGGFVSRGKSIWANLGGSYTLLNVMSPNPAFNPTPAGWSFSYHAISRIEGILHDAALDRIGIDARAAHAGRMMNLIELASPALPGARRGVPFASPVNRKVHTVALTIRDFGARIPLSAFSQVLSVGLPPGTGFVTIPVKWEIESGGFPPGLTLNGASGLVTGTPSAAGSYSVNVRTKVPNFETVTPVTMVVSP